MKILALDLGRQWVGTALSDSLGILAKPYKTVSFEQLDLFLKQLFDQETISKIVIGYPKTLKGTESQQTLEVIKVKEKLEELFPEKKWILWDERLSSKRAEVLKKAKTKEEKIHSHSVAAAFILESYLTYMQNEQTVC